MKIVESETNILYIYFPLTLFIIHKKLAARLSENIGVYSK